MSDGLDFGEVSDPYDDENDPNPFYDDEWEEDSEEENE